MLTFFMTFIIIVLMALALAIPLIFKKDQNKNESLHGDDVLCDGSCSTCSSKGHHNI